jgi:ABC-2 type transport system ATP-binding protein
MASTSHAMQEASAGAPLEVDGVAKVYPGGVRALDGVSFHIAAGERACLLGPNGAGKTTLIRLLTGALSPTVGRVRVFGLAVDNPAFLAAKRRVGIVPQSPGMYRDLTAGDYLHLAKELYGRGDVQSVSAVFGLDSFLTRKMADLSGGLQRRLAMAAALVASPDLLLLDEPTAGLDPVATREVHAFLRTMMEGRTVLLCTHNLAEAEALCESAVILRGGRMLLHERIEALRARIQPVVALSAVEGPARLSEALSARGMTGRVVGQEVQITLPEPARQTPELLRHLLGKGIDVYQCRILSPNLEDLFLDIVGGRDVRA